MENIQLVMTKYIFGFALQSFLTVLGIFTFNKQKIIIKEYLFTASILTLVTFFMKSLPIVLGVQTIMNMIFIYMFCVIYLKMQPYSTIKSTALCFVLILISEMITTAGTVFFFGQENFKMMINDVSIKHNIGTVANIIYAIIIIPLYIRLSRKGDYHRSTSEQAS